MTGGKNRLKMNVFSFLLAFVLVFSGIAGNCAQLPGLGVTEAEAATAKLSKTRKTLYVGDSFTLKVKNATKKYTFKSSDRSIAKVKTKTGKKTKIVAVSAGKATVTATLGKKELKCVITVKEKETKVTPTPVPTPIPVYSALTDNSSVFELPVGGKMWITMPGKEVRRFYTSDSDKQYLDVTEDGLITALKEAGSPVAVKAEDKQYNHYFLKIRILKEGEKVTAPTAVPTPTPTPTNAPTPLPQISGVPVVPQPTATPKVTATPVPSGAAVPTGAPLVTSDPTPTPGLKSVYVNPGSATLSVGDKLQLELVGAEALEFFLPFASDDEEYLDVTADGLVTAKKPVTDITVECMAINGKMYSCTIKILAKGSETKVDENGIGSDGLGNKNHYDLSKVSAQISLGDTYGLLIPHTREAYQKSLEYTIEDERGFIKACRDALEHGVEEFTIKYRGFTADYWWNKFRERIRYYSDMSGYTADGYTGTYDESAHTLTIKPVYKDIWKAVTYLRYTGYEADDDIKKLLNAAIQLTDDAVAANPGNTEGILLYVNNRICEMTTYTDPIPEETDCPQRDATGVFFYGDGVCESYTAAMRLVLNILGLQNDTVINKKGTHIWNRVMLDGTWYHIDITWNDVEDTRYGGYMNSYFMLTEPELIKKSTESKDEDERLDHLWNNFYN